MRVRNVRVPGAWLLTIGCVALAALVELGLRFQPEFDPFGWLVWGRQTAHLALDPAGAPTWKPLPWLATTPLSLAGGAAPALWLIVACAAGIGGLVLAYRLASRLGGPAGGVAAVLGILVCREYVGLLVVGQIEPVTVVLALGAVECHLTGRRRGAVALLWLATLARPECGPLLAVYGAWLLVVDRQARPWLVLAALGLAALWFLPPWIALGRGFTSNDPAFTSGIASHDPVTVAGRAATIVIWPIAAAAVVAFGWLVRGDGQERRAALALGAGAAAWVATTAIMAATGFPGIRRYMLPAAAAVCVLAGVGVGLLWTYARSLLGRRQPGPVVLGLGISVLALVACGYYGSFRVRDALDTVRAERTHAAQVRQLSAAVRAAGGGPRLRACGVPVARFGFQSSIAWELGVAVGAVGQHPARTLHRYAHVVLFASDPRERLPARAKLLGQDGVWRIYGVRTACSAPPRAAA